METGMLDTKSVSLRVLATQRAASQYAKIALKDDARRQIS